MKEYQINCDGQERTASTAVNQHIVAVGISGVETSD